MQSEHLIQVTQGGTFHRSADPAAGESNRQDNFLIDFFSVNLGYIKCNLWELSDWLMFKVVLFLLLWPMFAICDEENFLSEAF